MLEDTITGEEAIMKYVFGSVGKKLYRMFLFGDKTTYIGKENIFKENKKEEKGRIIVVNHPGVGKDIAAIIKLHLKENQQVFFTARKELFDKKEFFTLIEDYFKKNLFRQTIFLPFLPPRPLAKAFSNYLPQILIKTGMIPVDIKNESNREAKRTNINAVKKIKDYLLKGRTIVILQYNPEQIKSKYHSYLLRCDDTAAKLALHIYKRERETVVNIIPTSIYNAAGLLPLKDIVVNIGKEMNILPYLKEKNPIPVFTDSIEEKMACLLKESLSYLVKHP